MSIVVKIEKQIPMPDVIEMCWDNLYELDIVDFKEFYIGDDRYQALEAQVRPTYCGRELFIRARKVRQ